MSDTIDVRSFERMAEYLNQTGIIPQYEHSEITSGDGTHWHDERRRDRQCWSVAQCDNEHIEEEQYVAIRDTTDQFLYSLSLGTNDLMLMKAELVIRNHQQDKIQHQTQRVGECSLVRDFRDYECVYQDVDQVDGTTLTSRELKLSGVKYEEGRLQEFSVTLLQDPDSKIIRLEGDSLVLAGVLRMME